MTIREVYHSEYETPGTVDAAMSGALALIAPSNSAVSIDLAARTQHPAYTKFAATTAFCCSVGDLTGPPCSSAIVWTCSFVAVLGKLSMKI